MPDTFAITIISIVVFTVIAAFIKGRSKDKCLKSFNGDQVTLEEPSGKTVWGKLRVENTGLELVYKNVYIDKKGHEEKSFMLYKSEYPNIQALIRYHDELDKKNKKHRDKELKRVYHPSLLRRLKRKIQNIFKTVRDSVMEVVNLLIGQAKKAATPAGSILTSQDKYVSQLKQELLGSAGTSYEPLLERYIGHKVVLELIKGDKIFEYPGVLKDYSSEFIELLDVDYKTMDKPSRKVDLVISRKYGIIRHLGE